MNAAAAPVAAPPLHVVSFQMKGETYAIEIRLVQAVQRLAALTRVPNAPDFVEGVMNLRGKVLPVLNLRKRLGLPDAVSREAKNRLMIVELGGKTAGFIVDGVDRVLKIPADQVQASSTFSTGFEGAVREYIQAIARLENGVLMVILDFQKILTRKESQALEQIET